MLNQNAFILKALFPLVSQRWTLYILDLHILRCHSFQQDVKTTEYRFFILFISIFFFPVLYCSNLVYWQQRGSCNWVGLSLVHVFYTFSILYILQQVEEQCVLIKAWKEPLFGSEHLDRVISVVQTLPPSLPPSPSFLYLSIFFNLNSSLLLHPSLLVCVQTNDTQAWESALSLKRKERKVRKVFVVKAMLVVIS